jgi:hypothetical protein
MAGASGGSGGAAMYEVTLEIEPALAAEVERHLVERHIPEILATGCFRRVRLDRAADGRLRTCYEAASQADLDRYLRDHTARFRADFAASFPRGVGVRREVWTALSAWHRGRGV